MNDQVRAALTDRSPNRDRSVELALMQADADRIVRRTYPAG